MAGLPVMAGAVHETSSLVLGVVALAATVGVAGAEGGSFASVTLMVIVMLSSMVWLGTTPSLMPSRSRLSQVCTVTLYSFLDS